MNKRVVGYLVGSLAGSLGLVCVGPAMAEKGPVGSVSSSDTIATIPVTVQDATPPAPAAPMARSGPFVEEVIVTAQKREQNLQDVPIAVTAFTGEQLADKGVFNPMDLTLTTPGLQYGSLAGFSIIYLRGVGSDTFSPTADSSVATYIDGIYFPFTHGLAQSLGRVERIEVLKGPQGTLFGRNSTGGAINVITKDPGQRWEATVMGERANFDSNRVHAYLGAPLTETLSASIGAIYESSTSYYDIGSESAIDDLINGQAKGARVKLRWQPSEDWDFILGGVKLEQEGPDTTLFVQRDPSLVGAAAGVKRTEGNWEANLNVSPFNKVDARVGTFHATYDGSWATAKSITGYQHIQTDAQLDFEGSPANVLEFRSPHQFAKVFTQELQLLSNEGSWMSDRFDWIGGLYYIDSSSGFDPINLQAANVDRFLSGSAQGLEALSDLQFLFAPLGGIPTIGPVVRIFGVVDTKSYAAFGQATWHFTDELGLTVGGRYQTEEREIVKASTSVVVQPNPPVIPNEVVITPINFRRQSKSWNNFSPKVTVDYRFTDSFLGYATWTKGFKSGTFNAINIYTPPDLVDPEKVTSYELGMKSDLWDRRIRLNAAAFVNNIKDLQVFTVSLTSGGAANLENAAEAEIRGVEFDLTWAVTERLQIMTAGTYLKSEYLSFPEGQGWDPATGAFTENNDFTGNETVRSPEFTGNVGFVYSFPIGRGMLDLASDVYFNSGYYFDAQNDIPEEKYHQISARISYLYEPWSTRVTAFGKNLNNAYSTYTRYRNDFGLMDAQSPPRTYGVRLEWTFD